ncbi:MAG: protein kinase [Candidatus Fimenecus sp.]
MNGHDFCISCFNPLNNSERCPHCGRYQEENRVSYGLNVGTLLGGRYLVGEILGSGGFGITYKVFDTKLKQILAIKEYFPNAISTRVPGTKEIIVYKKEEFEAGKNKFITEAKNTGKFFNSNNIVKVFEYFEENGTVYYVMEYLNGITLKKLIKQNGGKLDLNLAVEITNGILDGLQEIHDAGFAHCDMAPDNVMLTVDNRVVIIDLGAAKYSDVKDALADIVVKMGYSPPEQYRSTEKPGAHTDMYAVGAMLYQMLTGIMPDESLDRQEKDNLQKPSKINEDIPKNLDGLCMRAMALESGLRIQNVKAFKAGLNGKIYRTPEEERKIRRIKGITSFAVVATIMILCVGLGIAFRGANSGVNLNKYIKEDTTVEIWIPYSLDEEGTRQKYDAVFDAFEKELSKDESRKKLKSEIRIKKVYVSEYEYAERLQEAYENGEMPDVYRTDLADSEYDAADLSWVKREIIKDNCALGKELDNYKYSLPISADCDVLYVNRKFDKENELSGAKTPDDLKSIAQRLVSGKNMADISVSNHCMAEERVGLAGTFSDPVNVFTGEKAPAYVGKLSDLKYIKDGVKWFTMMPYPDGMYNFTPAETWSVEDSSDKSHQYAAMYVLSYLLSDTAQEIMYIENESYMPLNKNVLDIYINETHSNDNLDYLTGVTFED